MMGWMAPLRHLSAKLLSDRISSEWEPSMGEERSRRANWKHGHFSREAKAERSRVRAAILALLGLRMLGH